MLCIRQVMAVKLCIEQDMTLYKMFGVATCQWWLLFLLMSYQVSTVLSISPVTNTNLLAYITQY